MRQALLKFGMEKRDKYRERWVSSDVHSLFTLYKYVFLAFIALSCGVGIMHHYSYKLRYIANAKVILPERRMSGSGGLRAPFEQLGGTANSSEEDLNRAMTRITSSAFLSFVARELKENERALLEKLAAERSTDKKPVKVPDDALLLQISRLRTEDLVARISQVLAASDQRQSYSILLRVSSREPHSASILANFIADSFVKYNYKINLGQITEVEDFIRNRLKEAEGKLNEVEARLADYKRKNSFTSPSDNSRKGYEKYARVEAEIENLKIKNGENERLVKFYTAKLKEFDSEVLETNEVEPEAADQADNVRSRIETLRKQQSALLAQGLKKTDPTLSSLGNDLEEKSRQLRGLLSADSRLPADSLSTAELNAKINEIEADSKRNSARIAALQGLLGETKASLASLPENERNALNLEREAALQYELFSQLKKRLQEVELQRAGTQNTVEIEEYASGASPEPRPSLVIRIIFFLFSGFFFGLATTLILEALNRTVKNSAEIEKAEIDCLGNIPFVDTKGRLSHPLVCATSPESAESMSFKFLRTHLGNIAVETPLGLGKVFSVISAERGAGKSFVAANLSVSFAQLGKKVALLDCDFRNPTQPKYFKFGGTGDGLSQVLQMQCTLSSIMIHSGVANLDIFPAGTLASSQTEVISTEKFKLLISYLRTKYDYVIIDAPPALFVVDGSLIGSMADASIFVARHRSTSYEDMVYLRKKVHKLTKKPLYGVLNGVREIHEYRNYSTRAYLEPGNRASLSREIRRMDFSEFEEKEKDKQKQAS